MITKAARKATRFTDDMRHRWISSGGCTPRKQLATTAARKSCPARLGIKRHPYASRDRTDEEDDVDSPDLEEEHSSSEEESDSSEASGDGVYDSAGEKIAGKELLSDTEVAIM